MPQKSKYQPDVCPWCGVKPVVIPWHGGGRSKRLVACENEHCRVGPSVCGSTRQLAVSYWNQRQGI